MLAIKKIRERLGLTQTAVARELGVSRQTYNNWELGKRQADYEYLLRLGELFNTSVENILTGCLEDAPPLTDQQEHLAELAEAGDPSPQVRMLMGLPEKEKKPLAGTRDFFRDMFSDFTEAEIGDLTRYARFLIYLRSHSED